MKEGKETPPPVSNCLSNIQESTIEPCGNTLTVVNVNTVGSLSLADQKRDILSRRFANRITPSSPIRSTIPKSKAESANVLVSDYVLTAQERAHALRDSRCTTSKGTESPRRLGHDSSSIKCVPTKINKTSREPVPNVTVRPTIDKEAKEIEAFVPEPKKPIAFAEASHVIRIEEAEVLEAKKRRAQRIKYLIVVGMVVLTIVVVPSVILTRQIRLAIVPDPSPVPTTSPTMIPTMTPTTQKVYLLMEDLSQYVQNSDHLKIKGTPQNSALHWIALEDEYTSAQQWDVQDYRFLQRFVLAVIHFALFDASYNYGKRTNWLSNTDECTWDMIACDDNGRVIVLSKSMSTYSAYWSGTMPPEIAHLKFLQKIIVPDQVVSGPVLAYLSDMANLEVLDLSMNQFSRSIPSDFAAKHLSLSLLDLSDNYFIGTIPSTIGSMPAMTLLDLHNNNFTGTIPSTIGSMREMTRLSLYNNDLTGEIPPELYTLTDLTFLDLRNNKLRGTIATQIGNLKNLTNVSFGASLLTGFLPSSLFTLTSLTALELSDSQFSGRLREQDFAQIVETISVITIENNDFSGPIPINAWESADELAILYIYGNRRLTGSITQTLCSKRGTGRSEIHNLKVGCNILCIEGCCEDSECSEVWPTSTMGLPN